jgi:predicted signal transduction protein with EAL and GGDEF domain
MAALRSSVPAWAFLACAAPAAVLSWTGPASLAEPLYLVVALASIAAVIVGAVRNQAPGRRRPWWIMAGALSAFLAGATLRTVVPGANDVSPPASAFLADIPTVAGYALLAYGFIHMLGQRRAGDDDPARADALLLGVGTVLAAWTFAFAPRIAAPGGANPGEIIALCFPLADMLLLVIVTQLLLADGKRKAALWLIGLAFTLMFAGDLLYMTWQAGLSAMPGELPKIFDTLFIGAFFAIGAATLHPTMRTLTEPQRVVLRRFGVARTAAIAGALVAPTAMAVLVPPASVWDAFVRVALSTVVTVTVVARVVRSNNSRAHAERAARWRATHDALTGLPNREQLVDTVSGWKGHEVSLLFLDLDRFKMVNDSWGHEVGDELLCAVAGRLRAAVRETEHGGSVRWAGFASANPAPAGAGGVRWAGFASANPAPAGAGIVCRIGGDEFVIALAGPAPSTMAERLAECLLVDFAEPFTLSIGAVIVTPSIGIARSIHDERVLDLIRDADTAMYKAKDSGRNGYALFDTSLREQVRTRVALEQALRGALERGELSVYYQPIVDLATGELDGFEALMRWRHPELGTVSPLQFVPIAEDTGLIVEAGAWLLEEAVTQLAQWRAARSPDRPPLHISVNISVRQLRDAALIGVVRRALDRAGLPASALWLEITESGVIEDPELSLATLRALRALGVVLCIDDFGTGYSSLTYLRQFPAGIVKIDRSFVNGVGQHGDDEAIVRTVIAMAHALGQRVVAEGVETAIQRDWLRGNGCNLVQGWLYGAPRPASALNGHLEPGAFRHAHGAIASTPARSHRR